MKTLNLGKTSLKISIIVICLAIVNVFLSWVAYSDTVLESDSILLFVFMLFIGGFLTALLLIMPLANLFGVGISLISLIEKREEPLWAWFGVVINGVSYLLALVFHFFATMLGAFFVCPIDFVGVLILIPVFIMIYRKRNKPIETNIEVSENISN